MSTVALPENKSVSTPVTPSTVVGIPINEIVMHIGAHTDEGFARWVLMKWGQQQFPGIDKANTRFVMKSPTLPETEYDQMGILPIGCGNARFDDHRTTGRLEDCSATKLVMEHLVIKNEAVQKIAREIHWCDTHAGVRNTELPELVKSAYRQINSAFGTNLVLKWLDQAFEALYKDISLGFIPDETKEKGVLWFFPGAVKARWFADKNLEDRIRKLLEVSAKFHKESVLEIDAIVRAMQRIGTSDNDIYEWLRFAFERLINDQVLFREAKTLAQCEENRYSIGAEDAKGSFILRMTVLHTDNPMALRAANAMQQDVIMIRNTNGNVQIFISHKCEVSLDTAMAMIRWMESPVDKRDGLKWRDLATVAGSHETAPHWYYNRDMGQIFNGSSTHPGVTPTQIGSKALIEALAHAFKSSLTTRWQRMRGIKA